MGDAWLRVWQEKGSEPVSLAGPREERLRTLLRLDGYDSPTASLSMEDWTAQLQYVRQTVGLSPDDSVFEVGCGAGAFLYGLQPYCCAVGGLDYSEPLLEIARRALSTGDLIAAEARDLPVSPRYDHVVSYGVFHYFPDDRYAAEVVRRMAAKAVWNIAVLDVNDAALREEALAERQRAYADSGHPHEELSQLFLHREFFGWLADELNCRLRIDDAITHHSISSRYRYNAFLFKKFQDRLRRSPTRKP